MLLIELLYIDSRDGTAMIHACAKSNRDCGYLMHQDALLGIKSHVRFNTLGPFRT